MDSNPSTAGAASSCDDMSLLLTGLQLRQLYLGADSFLHQNVVDFLLRDGGGPDDEGGEEEDDNEEEELEHRGVERKNCGLLAEEEDKLEREILRIIDSGNGFEAFKANSGQSVAIGDHNICVGVHEEPGSEYRLWQWHDHMMLFDEENGYSSEYIHVFHHELLPPRQLGRKPVASEEEEEECDSRTKVNAGGNRGSKS